MKIKGLLIAVVFMLSAVAVQAQDKMFEKFSDNKDITTVYISKALLSMVPNMDAGGVNVKGLANKLEKLEIYTSENKGAMKTMASEAQVMKKNKAYEFRKIQGHCGKAAYDYVERAITEWNYEAFSQHDKEFHSAIHRASKNELMSFVNDMFHQFLDGYFKAVNSRTDIINDSQRDHVLIFDAINRRRRELASVLMHEHLKKARDEYVNIIRLSGGESGE